MPMENTSLFKRLTKLFKSGPVVKRKIKDLKTPTTSTALDLFRKSNSNTFSNVINAYGQYDRMARYSDFAEMEYCLHGDTLIAVPGGYKTIKELSEEYGLDKEFVVYAYDHNAGELVPALAKQARHTRTDMAYKVTFDSGKIIIGTGNHRLMLRDGTYKRIDELKPSDSMMPFYRKDLMGTKDETGAGYRWIYSMRKRDGYNGWVPEHRMIAEWMLGRELLENEVVHHKNFIANDNSPQNLEVMSKKDHQILHAKILNGKKWSPENSEWIEKFKKQHSTWMRENNPNKRHDITFGRILELAERFDFSSRKICDALDTDINVIKRVLLHNGFNNFEVFAAAYCPGWKNRSHNNVGSKNPRFNYALDTQKIFDAYSHGMSLSELSDALGVSPTPVVARLKEAGYQSYTDFKENYENHKVVSVEEYGVIPLYDLTVDGYKNFATDSVVSHNTPEISAALDIYADEVCAQDVKGRSLHIYSDNPRIKKLLEELFYDTLNVEFNLRQWTRNLCKFGDFFLFNDVSPEHGILNAFPIPVNEVEREEGYDTEDPLAFRFRWIAQGNQILENWQVTHFRLLGNDAFLPYGSSVIEPARRIWRQLVMIEDAMLVYRVVRSPERRVFYIDVGNVPVEDIPNYMEQAKARLKTNQVIDKNAGRVDLRYNPLSVDEDYFIPVRGGESGTKIDTLPGGSNSTDIDDVNYIQSKLFAALKVPKAYLGYDESIGSKATLAQEDIRFSRTVSIIQRTLVAELNKLATIHLFANGFTDEELINFDLQLSNPSTVAQQQKLELFRTKFEIMGSVPEGMLSRDFLRREIMEMSDEEIKQIETEKEEDRVRDLKLESLQPPSDGGPGPGGLGGGGGGGAGLPNLDDIFAGATGDEADEAASDMEDAEGAEVPPDDDGAPEEGDEEDEDKLLTSNDSLTVRPKMFLKLGEDDESPISPIARSLYNRGRRDTRHRDSILAPDFATTTTNIEALKDPFGTKDSDLLGVRKTRKSVNEGFEKLMFKQAQDYNKMTVEMQSILKKLDKDNPKLMTEIKESDEILDSDLVDQ